MLHGIMGRWVLHQALNQTLSRTIITSGTVFLATLSLYLFGGGVLSAGSPAVMYACDYLISVVAEDLSCNRRLGVEAVEKDTDCAFDAAFGYPCASH